MTAFFTAITASALFVLALAHLALLGYLATSRPRLRALVAILVPPLAPYWTWRSRSAEGEPDTRGARAARRLVYVWTLALALYTFGVLVVSR